MDFQRGEQCLDPGSDTFEPSNCGPCLNFEMGTKIVAKSKGKSGNGKEIRGLVELLAHGKCSIKLSCNHLLCSLFLSE